jgi:hypothetical protein
LSHGSSSARFRSINGRQVWEEVKLASWKRGYKELEIGERCVVGRNFLSQAKLIRGMKFKHTKGAAIVEFALVAPLFFLLAFGIIDFGRLFYTQMTLQEALREAGRFAVTGRTLTNTMTRVESIKAVAQRVAGIPLDGITVMPPDGGGPRQSVTVSLTYRLTLITPFIGRFFNDGIYQFTVGTTFQNEPFPTN